MSKKKIIPGTPNLQNTAYFDLNRNFSIKSDDTSTWEYPINNGMRLPAGTGIEIINTHLNYPGIVGSAIEILDDIEETISYGFYNVHGSFFTLTPEKYGSEETGIEPSDDGTKGLLLYDVMTHRNTENNSKAPLLKVDTTTTIDNDPDTEITAVKAEIPDFDLTNNVDNPEATLQFNNLLSDEIYEEYYENFFDATTGGLYTSFANDRVIDIVITGAGVNYSVGDRIEFTGGTTSNKRALGWVTGVDAIGGFITSVKLAQIGEDYTSTPTVNIVSASGGVGATLTPVMGGAFGTTTNGSGTGLVVAMQGDFSLSSILRILRNGLNYRYGDLIYVNDGSRPNALKFPQDNSLKAFPDELNLIATCKVGYTTSYDIPSPGFFEVSGTGTNKETIYYRNASATSNVSSQMTESQPILFTQNENPRLPNENYTATDMFNHPQAGYYQSAQNAKYKTQLREYLFPPSQVDATGTPFPTTDGQNYKWIPTIEYRPSQYEEPFLNTDITEPMFIPVMTVDYKVDRIVYLPGCRNDISSMNTFIDYSARSKGSALDATYGCPPGFLSVTGGDPTVQAEADFIPSFLVNFDTSDNPGETSGQTYGFPEELTRYVNNTGGVKLGLNLGIINSGQGLAPGSYELQPIIGDELSGSGSGCIVDHGVGFGFGSGPLFSLNVTTSGTGYKVGERYTIAESANSVVVILAISNDGTITNNDNSNNRNAQLIRPNNITGGIMDPLSNSVTKPALIKGKTSKLPGGTTTQTSVTGSTLPRFNFSPLDAAGFDDIEGCGGSNDPLGCVEFTEDGFLKPFIQQETIKIPRGVYGVNQLGTLVSDQLTKTTEDDYISSPFSKLIPINDYEICNFSGVQNAQAGRKIFISMSDYNTLMQLYRDGETIPDSFKWDNYRFTNYYAFPKNIFPSGKSVTLQIASNRVQTNGTGPNRAKYISVENSNIGFYEGGIYDQTRDGVLVGTTDFQLQYNEKKSIYEIQFLHSAIRNPEYDKFGNQFSQPGVAGAFLKILSKQINVIGMRNQYRFFPGAKYETPPELLKRFTKPITRDTGVMIYNFGYENSQENGSKSFTNPQYAKYEDFFTETTAAKTSWEKTIWSRLGFTYEQLNTDDSRQLCQYLFTDTSKAVRLYGITTTQALDSSVTTTISSITNHQKIVNTQNGTKSNTTADQRLFNMTTRNNPTLPVFTKGGPYNTAQPYKTAPAGFDPSNPIISPQNPTNNIPIIYSSGLYNSALTNFVETDGDPLTAQNLPLLVQEGYFLITSDIIDSYKDSVKKNENIPVLAIVPKSNLASQDFVTTAFTNISHTLSQEKVINKILVKVLNPDLTAPILREDSSILMKITIPEEENIEI